MALMSTIDLRGRALGTRELRDLLPRADFDVAAAVETVRPICEDVRHRGSAALYELGERFDGVRPPRLRVPEEVLAAALGALDGQVRDALEESIRRARLVHERQRPAGDTVAVVQGGDVTNRWTPVDRVGLYVPGGRAVYPSSVVMNVVPAQVARVGSIAVASPPQRDNSGVFAGYPHPTVLAACALLGVDEVYAVGGAQAVAAFAFGFEDATDQGVGGAAVTCEPVSLVTGPGNIYVAAAKRYLKGVIGIDSEAGPTEIMVLADDTADPVHVAADLVSQAEHDPQAASVLVTHSPALAAAVSAEVDLRAGATKHSERVHQALTGPQSAIVLVDDLDTGFAVVNAYGAEHLELQVDNAAPLSDRVTNAGAIFVGPYSPVSLGDYLAGSNHVLPTGGCACHSSGLSVTSFLKSVQVIHYSPEALRNVADQVVTLAGAEDLPAHGEAVQARFDDGA